MFKKLWKWIKSNLKIGVFTDFPDAKKCDPNDPCRTPEPNDIKGFKITTKF